MSRIVVIKNLFVGRSTSKSPILFTLDYNFCLNLETKGEITSQTLRIIPSNYRFGSFVKSFKIPIVPISRIEWIEFINF